MSDSEKNDAGKSGLFDVTIPIDIAMRLRAALMDLHHCITDVEPNASVLAIAVEGDTKMLLQRLRLSKQFATLYDIDYSADRDPNEIFQFAGVKFISVGQKPGMKK